MSLQDYAHVLRAKYLVRMVVLVVAAVVGPQGPAFADSIKFTFYSGYEFSNGRYGAAKSTQVETTYVTAKLIYDDWSLRIFIPYLMINGPSDIAVIGGGNPGTTTAASASTGEAASAVLASPAVSSGTRSGLGDTSVYLSRTFSGIGGTSLYSVARVMARLPTGSYSKGLGVGTFDFGVGDEVGYEIGRGGFYGLVDWRARGNRAGGIRRLDGWHTGLGGWFDLNTNLQMGLYGDWRGHTSAGLSNQVDLGSYGRYRLRPNLSLLLYGEVGFTKATPDELVGLQLSWSP